LVTPVQTSALAAINTLGDISPKYVPCFFLREVTDEPDAHPARTWGLARRGYSTRCSHYSTPTAGFVNEGASESGNTSVADVVSALQSAQSAMSGCVLSERLCLCPRVLSAQQRRSGCVWGECRDQERRNDSETYAGQPKYHTSDISGPEGSGRQLYHRLGVFRFASRDPSVPDFRKYICF
jgi:hypothetical protein